MYDLIHNFRSHFANFFLKFHEKKNSAETINVVAATIDFAKKLVFIILCTSVQHSKFHYIMINNFSFFSIINVWWRWFFSRNFCIRFFSLKSEIFGKNFKKKLRKKILATVRKIKFFFSDLQDFIWGVSSCRIKSWSIHIQMIFSWWF